MLYKLRLHELRQSRGLSQTELGKRSGIFRQTVCMIENGVQQNLSVDTLCRLAIALDAT